MMKLRRGEAISKDDQKDLEAALGSELTPYNLNHGDINKELKTKCFKHKDIAPYGDLMEDSKDFDRAIARNIIVVERG